MKNLNGRTRGYENDYHEDFYENFGNNLARIQILSEILDENLSSSDVNAKQLIVEIREHCASLWLGSRDTLWALMDVRHTLGELVTRLNRISQEIFKNIAATDILWEKRITIPETIIAPDYCLNILIAFKEIMLGYSKYPDALFIRVIIEHKPTGEITIHVINKGGQTMQQYLENSMDLFRVEKCIRRLGATFSVYNTVEDVLTSCLTFKVGKTAVGPH